MSHHRTRLTRRLRDEAALYVRSHHHPARTVGLPAEMMLLRPLADGLLDTVVPPVTDQDAVVGARVMPPPILTAISAKAGPHRATSEFWYD